jgi:hypothetical protein
MSDQDYLWVMVFKHDPSFQSLRMYLDQMGGFEAHVDNAFRPPGGRPFPALIVPKEVIELAKSLRLGSGGRLRYQVFRKNTKTDKIEEWPLPPPAKPKKKKEVVRGMKLPEGVTTGAALLKKKRKSARSREESVDDLPLPGGV